MSRRQAVLCLATGVVLLIAAPFAWAGLTPDPAGESVTDLNAAAAEALAGSPPTSPQQSPESAPEPVGSEPASTSVPPTDLAPAVPETTAGQTTALPPALAPAPATTPVPATPVVPAPGPPDRLRMPTLGIDSPVIPIGVTGSGELEIPEDVDDIGWYRYGPVPGEATGSAVLSGHVDSATQGAGPFARLGELAEGDLVTVVDASGAAHDFTVLSREEWAKSEVPLDRIFDRGGSPRLVLITCGGDFDADAGHYEDNIAITAVPVPAGPA
ncbi:class F sortase [Nakamurella deserti]|uniref:class F sortase n=1 Tax=Nakamurella deserti TaxID=2164074 RepID=UPI0013002989|nr:class F sortase [Nakamurella deserti]